MGKRALLDATLETSASVIVAVVVLEIRPQRKLFAAKRTLPTLQIFMFLFMVFKQFSSGGKQMKKLVTKTNSKIIKLKYLQFASVVKAMRCHTLVLVNFVLCLQVRHELIF